jgi:hypothetical protein
LAANRGRVVAAITIHSFSQLWMSPYGYQNALPTDYDEMVSYYYNVINLFEVEIIFDSFQLTVPRDGNLCQWYNFISFLSLIDLITYVFCLLTALTATYGTVFQYGNIADTICKFNRMPFSYRISLVASDD